MEFSIEESRLNTPEDGVVIGVGDEGAPIHAAEVVTSTVRGKLSVPSGRAAVAEGVESDSKSRRMRAWVILAARVGEAEGG